MAQQQSFLDTVRKQIHSIYMIIQLLEFDNIPAINTWQLLSVLLNRLQLNRIPPRKTALFPTSSWYLLHFVTNVLHIYTIDRQSDVI